MRPPFWILWHGGSGACTAASQQEGPGFDSPMGCCWSWGVGSPQAFSAQVGYLPGLSVWSLHVVPVFTRVYSTKKPSRRTELSVPDQDGSLDLVPGRLKAAHCSWGVLEEEQSRMGEMQRLHSLRPQACVCPVSPLYMHVCVTVCRLCE